LNNYVPRGSVLITLNYIPRTTCMGI